MAKDCDPPVTLVLMTFNQEAFVADAIQSAFNQDYTNLEILVSDHCSSDRTWAILNEMVREYAGPHTVILNRSTAPGGVLGHAFDAVSRAAGNLIVAAAGDDVSEPHRVSRLVQAWKSTSAVVLCSAIRTMDKDGCAIPDWRPGRMIHDAASYFPGGGVFHIVGAAAAYDRSVFDEVSMPSFEVVAEDFFLALMLGIRGARFKLVAEPLVRRRIHSSAASARVGATATLKAAEEASAKYSRCAANLLRYVELEVLGRARVQSLFSDCARVNLCRLRSDANFHEARARWYELSVAQRVTAILRVHSLSQLRWMLPRVFGLQLLALVRQIAACTRSIFSFSLSRAGSSKCLRH